jgi:hypothetical protein
MSAVWYCSHYLPPVSTTPAVPVAKFATGVFDTGGAPSLREFLKKNPNDPNFIFGGLGEDDSWKKPVAKNLETLSL